MSSIIDKIIRKAANEATEAVKKYDQHITNLSIINGESRESNNKLLGDLAEKSINFKVDISDLESAEETLLRTGKTISETNKYIENTIYLSKLGFQDMDTSASQLVTIGNAYGYTADEMSAVVDKFVKLDTSANVTAGKLSEAVSTSAQNAKLAGFNIDQLAASIAGLKDIVNGSESQVANSLNMIFSRLQNVKLGKYVIETDDGSEDITEALNDTEKILNTVNIKLRDSKNEFRDINDLFTELSDNWNKFNSVQQSAIATTIAGARQRNTFIALIENWNKIQELTDVSLNSMGTAVEKYDNYLQSIEAKSATLNTSIKELWNNLLPTDFVGDITDAATSVVQFTDKYQILQTALKSAVFYGLAKGVISAKSSLAGMVKDLRNVSYAMNLATQSGAMTGQRFTDLQNITKVLTDKQLKLVLSNSNLSEAQMITILSTEGVSKAEAKAKLQTLGLVQANKTAAISTFSLSGAFKSLWATIAANPVMSLTIAFTTVVSVINIFNQKQKELAEKTKELGQTAKETTKDISSLYAKYIELNEAVNDGTGSKEDLKSATDDLLNSLGLEGVAIDELKKKYNSLEEAMSKISLEKLKESHNNLVSSVGAYEEELLKEGKNGFGSKNVFKIDSLRKELNLKGINGENIIDVLQSVKGLQYTLQRDVVNGTHATNLFKLLGNSKTIEGIKQNYETLIDMQDVLISKFGAEQIKGTDIYKEITNRLNELKTAYENYTNEVTALNQSAAQIAVLENLKDKELPKTQEEFKAFYDELIANATQAGSDLRSRFTGTDDEIKNSIKAAIDGMSVFNEFTANTVSVEVPVNPSISTDTSKIKSGLSKLKEEITDIFKNTNLFDKAVESLNKDEVIDFDTVMSMVELDNSLADKFIQTADGYTIAVDTLISARQKYTKETRESIQADIESSNRSIKIAEQNIAKMQKQSDFLDYAASKDNGAYQAKKELNTAIQSEKNNIDELNQAISEYTLILGEMESGVSSAKSSIEDISAKIQEYADTYDKIVSNNSLVISAIKEQEKYGKISGDTVKKLIDAGYKNALAYNEQTGEVVLLTDAVRDLTNEQIRNKQLEIQNEINAVTTAVQNAKIAYDNLAKSVNSAWDAQMLALYGNNIEQLNEKLVQLQEQQMIYSNPISFEDNEVTNETAAKTNKNFFEEEKAELDHLLEMDVIDKDEYYQRLTQIVNQYYKDKKDYLDEYRKYEEEIYKHLKQEKLNAIDEEINRLKSVNDEKQKEIDLEEKKLALENARNQKTVAVYDSERGWIRETNRENVKNAQKDYDNAVIEQKVSALGKIKESIENGSNVTHSDSEDVDIQVQVDNLVPISKSISSIKELLQKFNISYDANKLENNKALSEMITGMGNPNSFFQSVLKQNETINNNSSQNINNSSRTTQIVINGDIVTSSAKDFVKQMEDIADSRFTPNFETHMNQFGKELKQYRANHK